MLWMATSDSRERQGDPDGELGELVASGPVVELPAGFYEVLVTEGLKARLDALDAALSPEQRPLHAAEAPDRVAWHHSSHNPASVAPAPALATRSAILWVPRNRARVKRPAEPK